MDERTACLLRDLNTRFYAQAAKSFGGTRHNRWPGWERLLEVPGVVAALGGAAGAAAPAAGGAELAGGEGLAVPMGALATAGAAMPAVVTDALATAGAAMPAVVTDLACGNLRFEVFLERALPGLGFAFQAVDNTTFPVWEPGANPVAYRSVDLLDDPQLDLGLADLAVSFGFLHHVPGAAARAVFCRLLLDQVRPGGFAAVSLWRFLDEPSLAKRMVDPQVAADAAGIDAGQLEPGDAFLGWDNQPGLMRYCHSFSDEDIAELVAAVAEVVPGAKVVARYRADGRNGALNEYVVWRRSE